MAIRDRLHTVEEFEQLLRLPENDERLLELINGEIVERMPTEEHGVIALNIGMVVGMFVRQHRLGRVGVEIRYQIPGDVYNSLMPDISFTSTRNPMVTAGSVPRMPDLAVEIKSPSGTVKDLRRKAIYYLDNGTRLVWLVYPQKRIVELYSADADVELLLEGDTLTGGDVLPGFTMKIAEIFVDPLAE